MIYKEEKRNLFSVSKDYYLAHCISADFKMGKGIATTFNRKYNLRERLCFVYGNKWYEDFSEKLSCADVIIDKENKIINLITKTRYWDKPTKYSMRNALTIMRDGSKQLGIKKIAMPKIGCGLDKLKWEDVSEMIKDIFENTDIEILVCYL